MKLISLVYCWIYNKNGGILRYIDISIIEIAQLPIFFFAVINQKLFFLKDDSNFHLNMLSRLIKLNYFGGFDSLTFSISIFVNFIILNNLFGLITLFVINLLFFFINLYFFTWLSFATNYNICTFFIYHIFIELLWNQFLFLLLNRMRLVLLILIRLIFFLFKFD